MRATDLDLREMLEFEPTGGVIRFAGDRALLFNTVALGLLRRELVETLGLVTARGVLTRFGYAHGWRTAEALRQQFEWDSEHEWQLAGGRVHQLQGFLIYEPVPARGGRATEGVRAIDLARVLRSPGASRAARPVHRAGLLDPGGLRERISELRGGPAHPLLRGEVRGEG